MEFNDLKSQYFYLKDKIDQGIQEVLSSCEFILGNKVEEFEKKLAEYVGVKYAISCSDGTAALQLIYMAYGIGVGDAVFCPDMTFIATIEPACLLGATPVFCDIDMDSYNICCESLEKQIKAVIQEGKLIPKAVVGVDFVGNPADFDRIRKITDQYGLFLIEDAAQGMGAFYKGKACGSLGDIAATSFFPSKPLGCYGDGGAVFTNDDNIAEKIYSLRVHGKGIDKYHNIYIGINSRLDAIQAAVLLPKLEELPNENRKRQIIAQNYNDHLREKYIIPYIEEDSLSAYAQYIVMKKESGKREQIIQELKGHDIPAILYYPTPMHRLTVFQNINHYAEKFMNTIKYSEEAFGIPFSPYLSEDDQRKVIQILLGI